jgi:hypothetical protein
MNLAAFYYAHARTLMPYYYACPYVVYPLVSVRFRMSRKHYSNLEIIMPAMAHLLRHYQPDSDRMSEGKARGRRREQEMEKEEGRKS